MDEKGSSHPASKKASKDLKHMDLPPQASAIALKNISHSAADLTLQVPSELDSLSISNPRLKNMVISGEILPMSYRVTPLHVLTALDPPKSVFLELEQKFANFFWDGNSSFKRRHWCSWANFYKSQLDNVLGLRRLDDTALAFAVKKL